MLAHVQAADSPQKAKGDYFPDTQRLDHDFQMFCLWATLRYREPRILLCEAIICLQIELETTLIIAVTYKLPDWRDKWDKLNCESLLSKKQFSIFAHAFKYAHSF